MPPFGSRRRRRYRTVTASAVHVDARRSKKNPGKRGADTSWQDRAWALFDELGEIHYAVEFFGKAMGKLRLLVEEQNADGEWEEVTTGLPFDALERIRGPEGGRAALQSQYGRLRFLVGESYLFVSRNDEAAAEQWEVLSVDEITVPKSGEGYERRSRTSGATPETFTQAEPDGTGDLQPGEAIAYRLWQPHPRRSSEADSPMRAVLDVGEELQILSRAVRGRARSRAAGAGLLLVPESVSPAPTRAVGDEDPAEDPFMNDLAEALVTPIADEESAAAVVPFLIRGPEDALDRIRHVALSADSEHGYPEQTLRAELIRRMAQGLDLPVEVLLGFAGANHWSGWLVDDQTWSNHLQPGAEGLCADLTAVYLRRVLGDEQERFRIWYDASAIINKPDRSRDAKDLHDRGALSDAALREAGGFEETDAPDDAERKVWVGLQLGDVGLATGGEPTPAAAPAPAPAPGVQPGVGPADGEQAPPQAEAARLLGAAEAAFWRCRQAAGSRLLTRLQRETGIRAKVRGVDTGDVAHVLGAGELARLDQDADALVAGGAECLISTVGPGGGQLQAAVERWAAETLVEARADLTNGASVRTPLEVRQLATRLARRR